MKIKRIPLTQNRFAVVDADDYDKLSNFKWHVQVRGHTCYAARNNGPRIVTMHREILKPPVGMLCDHINHDGLDNRRCNLRICTAAQNSYNKRPRLNKSSRYKGVFFDPYAKKWLAKIMYRGMTIHIGSFEFEPDAAIAYDDIALKLFGEFAWLNCTYRPEVRQWQSENYLFV